MLKNDKLMAQSDDFLRRSTKFFTILTCIVCGIFGSMNLIRGVPYTPYIIFGYLGIFLLFVLQQKRFRPRSIVFILGCLTITMVFSLASVTGGFMAPVFKWLLPVFIYVALSSSRRGFLYFIGLLILYLGTFVFLSFWEMMPVSVAIPDKTGLRAALSSVSAIVAGLVLIQDYRQRNIVLEKSLEESHERNRLIIEASGTGIWDWPDVTKDDVFWSPHLYKILKLDPVKVSPSAATFNSMMFEGEQEKSQIETSKQLEHGDTFTSVLKMKNSEDETIWVQSSGLALKNEEGVPYRMLGAIQDITELIEAKEELEQEKGKCFICL